MKQPKILFLVVIALFALLLVSCIPGTAQPMGGWSGATVHDGIIYVGTRDGRVVAINASTQSEQERIIWDSTITPATLIYTTPIVAGDLVYVGTYSGQIYALTIARGTERWVYPRTGSMGAIVGRPVIANETIYISSSDGMVHALDTTYGDLKWKSEHLADKLWTSPTVMGDTLYVSTFDGHIFALSAGTGELLDWSFESEAGFASSPVIYEDTIYVGSFDNNLYAIRIDDGELLWKFRGGKWFWAAPLVSEEVVYAACLDGKLYAIDAETGEELWPLPFESKDQKGKPAPIVSSPVLIGNLVIVANEAGNVYVINRETGDGERIKNRENGDKSTINAQIRASLCAHEGLVYIRDEDNKDNRLYVVDIDKMEVSEPIPLTIKE
jgi:outer membrane protein assembly factor BamB